MAKTNRSYIFLQIWVLLAGIAVFACYVAYDLGYFARVVDADQSKLSILIAGLFLGATFHAIWHILRVTRQIDAAYAWLGGKQAPTGDPANEEMSPFQTPEQFVAGYVSQVIEAHKQSTLDNKDGGLVFEIYADRLRAAVEIGWYLVDILIRLGLIGTIVGFILILGALSSGPSPTPENIQTLLISMSGGMGTALYTTLAGLVTAMVLGAQYMVLARGTEELIGKLVRIRDQANVS
ncbi:MAG: MotA/TolQ/ExbB proton channel family protein [Anderseniella sp.]